MIVATADFVHNRIRRAACKNNRNSARKRTGRSTRMSARTMAEQSSFGACNLGLFLSNDEKQCCICICKAGFTDVLLLYLSCWYPCFFSVKQEDSAHDSTLKIVKIDKYALFACNRYTRTVRSIISNICS